MEPSYCAALFVVGRMESDRLPGLAAGWLADGLDSPSLRALAGAELPIMSEVAPLFRKALHEIGVDIPTKDEALMMFARDYAERIVAGSLTAHAGAGLIWWHVTNEMERPSQLLLSFVGAASELDDLEDRTAEDGADRKEYRRQLEEQILESARDLLK